MAYVIATVTFNGPDRLVVEQGAVYEDTDRAVKAHPSMFRPIADTVVRSPELAKPARKVEAATADPGKDRTARHLER